MSKTDDELEGLLRAVRRAEDPSEADRAAVREALAGALAASVVAPGVATAAKAGALLAKGSMLTNVALPLVAGALLGGGVWATVLVVSSSERPAREPRASAPAPERRTASAPRSSHVQAPASANAIDGALEHDPAQRERRSAGRAVTSATSAESQPPKATFDPLELESRAMAEVQRALRDGDPGRALSLIEAEERAHPSGALRQERAAARVFALCSLERASEAASAAADFTRRFPSSPLGDRVRASCATPASRD